MINITQTIYLDFDANSSAVIYANQYDCNTREIEIVCLHQGSKFILDKNEVSAALKLLSPDKKCYYIDDVVIVNDEGNLVLTLTDKMLSKPGVNSAQILITNGKAVISTAIFKIVVQKSIYSNDAILEQPDFDVLTSSLAQVTKMHDDLGSLTQVLEKCNTNTNTVINDTAIVETSKTLVENWTSECEQYHSSTAQNASKAASSEANALSYMNSALSSSIEAVEAAKTVQKIAQGDTSTYFISSGNYDESFTYHDVSAGAEITEGKPYQATFDFGHYYVVVPDTKFYLYNEYDMEGSFTFDYYNGNKIVLSQTIELNGQSQITLFPGKNMLFNKVVITGTTISSWDEGSALTVFSTIASEWIKIPEVEDGLTHKDLADIVLVLANNLRYLHDQI